VTALRPLARDDLPALLAIQHATAGSGARWTADALETPLFDPAHDQGRRAVVAERAGAIVGGAGWVEAGREMFGFPVVAADGDAAGRLVDHLVARACAIEAVSLRISAGDGEQAKADALRAQGFAVIFDFVTLRRGVSPLPAPSVAPVRRPLASLDVAAYRDLHNETFATVPSSPPLDDDDVRHLLGRHWPEGSGVWVDADGAPAGFVLAILGRDGDVAYVEDDAIGVRAPWRRHGLATAMLAHMIDATRAAGLREVRALIASTNAGSLGLHLRVGFAEASRRSVWELRF